MLTHAQIWTAIDRLAERYGLTASGLARRAGLDATSFNRSKRVSPDGRARWPSTESIAKVLSATGASLVEFVALIDPTEAQPGRTLPVVAWADAGAERLFGEDGMPAAAGLDEIEFPDTGVEKIFAVEVAGGGAPPVYRDGDIVVVSPSAQLRKGDRLLMRLSGGEVVARELARRTLRTIEVRPLAEGGEETHRLSDVAWLARIMWLKQ